MGRVVILEERKQSGWRGFGKELQLLLSPDHNNGHGPQQEQESRQNRSVGDGVEKPRYNGDLVSGEKGLYTYAGVVGIKTPMKIVKQLESEPLVPLVSESDRGSIAVLATESYFQTIPKIPIESKIRHPLRCFSKSKSS